ncbi:MAG: tetratricopeptide repeat protein [Betaproteobacteria bacterium]|nr:MAG: tetratricopeptide repeat protein [Betaproteobacteria bacterium]
MGKSLLAHALFHRFVSTSAIARNAPCPCGSGRRYKDCHGALTSVNTAPAPDAAALDQYAYGLFDRGDFAGAAHAYERLRAHRGLSAESLVRLGAALEKSGRLADAEARYREAAARAPDHAEIHSNIGSVCVLQQRFADADEPLMRAPKLDPRDAYSLAMLAHARQQCCAWDGIVRLFRVLRRMLETPSELRWPIVPFPLLAMPLSPRHLRAAAHRWSRSFAPSPPKSRPAWHARPGERLRVGFVSSDFRPHPLVVVLTELWERLDRNRVETFAYGLLPEDNSEVGLRVKRAFEHFADVCRSPMLRSCNASAMTASTSCSISTARQHMQDRKYLQCDLRRCRSTTSAILERLVQSGTTTLSSIASSRR